MDAMPKRCTHRHATMVQAIYRELGPVDGWFVTWQCDDCGSTVMDRAVTYDDLQRGADLPWFDFELWGEGVEHDCRSAYATAQFMHKATR